MNRMYDLREPLRMEINKASATGWGPSLDATPLNGASPHLEERGAVKEAETKKEELLPRRLGSYSTISDRASRHVSEGGQPTGEIVKLVQRLFSPPNSRAPRLVVFAGVDEDWGSSGICSRVGEVLAAQVSGSVCLVDAQLRAPSLHALLGVKKSPGFADAMISATPITEFAIRISNGNLWVVPPGRPTLEGLGLFASDRLGSRMLEFTKFFDYVLIDAPPLGSSGDAVLLGSMTDGVVLVIEANSTRRQRACRAKEAFDEAGVLLLGAVLNKRTFPIPSAIYRKL
jgi:Mrp family chromosome partitioning ATPase